KSKMLLPRAQPVYEEDTGYVEDEEGDDPRAELVQQLLEYKRYKEATVHMRELEEERQLLFSKVPVEWKEDTAVVTKQLEFNFSIYDLLFSYSRMIQRKRLKQPIVTRVEREETTIEDEMNRIVERIRRGNNTFYAIIDNPFDREQVVLTFLAVLHMLKERIIDVVQCDTFGDIQIQLVKEEECSEE
ncbi:MAG: segregation and condensation protein A, partial [Bacilli bacterium]